MTEQHALSFGQIADRYDQARPSYPPAALDWALGGGARRIVDLGAGTGILSRGLLDRGHQVLAVEPDPGMRARLAATTPRAATVAGSAEQVPLRAASVDAVVAGQSYHWFVPERAHPEIARVLRPGGVFAAIWNLRDESVPWVARLSEVLADERAADHIRRLDFDLGPWFGPVTCRRFRHELPMTADGLAALVTTRSYYLVASPSRQRELIARVRKLAAGLPTRFSLPYETFTYRTARSRDPLIP